MIQNLTGTHALVILAIIVLVFGAAKLPALAKSVGQSVKILKKEASDDAPASSPGGASVQETGAVAPDADADAGTSDAAARDGSAADAVPEAEPWSDAGIPTTAEIQALPTTAPIPEQRKRAAS